MREMPRAAILAVLALALLARLAVPVGWMPMADAHGLRIVPCTGMGPMKMAPAQHAKAAGSRHHAPDSQDQDKDQHPCSGAGITAAITQPRLSIGGLPSLPPRTTAIGLALAVYIGRGLAAPPPPSTGPPFEN